MLLIRKSVSKTQQHKTDTELSMCVRRVISEKRPERNEVASEKWRDEIKSFLKNDRNEEVCVKGEQDYGKIKL